MFLVFGLLFFNVLSWASLDDFGVHDGWYQCSDFRYQGNGEVNCHASLKLALFNHIVTSECIKLLKEIFWIRIYVRLNPIPGKSVSVRRSPCLSPHWPAFPPYRSRTHLPASFPTSHPTGISARCQNLERLCKLFHSNMCRVSHPIMQRGFSDYF